ncbi:MAG: hypothetical protein WAZ14_02740 [Patescibacteria group bacterium]
MLTKTDISLLKGMFETQKKDIILDMRDETRSVINAAITASEQRMTNKLDKLEQKIDRVASDAAELIGDSILPQIDELRRADARIKKFVGMV